MRRKRRQKGQDHPRRAWSWAKPRCCSPLFPPALACRAAGCDPFFPPLFASLLPKISKTNHLWEQKLVFCSFLPRVSHFQLCCVVTAHAKGPRCPPAVRGPGPAPQSAWREPLCPSTLPQDVPGAPASVSPAGALAGFSCPPTAGLTINQLPPVKSPGDSATLSSCTGEMNGAVPSGEARGHRTRGRGQREG